MIDLWRAAAPDALAWRQWDDDVVLYNDATGSTHHLGPLGGEVMLCLLRHPGGIDVTALSRDMSAIIEIPDELHLVAEIQRALDDLALLQLVERVSA